jgi:hypothetical protein
VANNKLGEWVGRHVAVELAQYGQTLSYRFTATLESTDEWGLGLSYQRGGAPDRQHSFFPWHNVRFVRLVEEPPSSGSSGERTEPQSGAQVDHRSPGEGESHSGGTHLRRGVTMKPELHPEAAENFNEKAQALLAKVEQVTEQGPSE